MRMNTLAPRATTPLACILLCAAAAATTQEAAPAPQRGGAAPSDDAFEMGSPAALAPGLAEEDMWPAATAEGWKKPCLVRWQRSFDDAVLVAHEENRPLLVAVNMDGEIASEHFAGVRYREPDTAAMMARYVCVMASVYRHTPRDYDEEGRRIECPRFERITCGEHIQAERELYDKYFDGKRISPRHIVLDLEGNETLDVYYSWDTQTVFTTFVKGVEDWPEPNDPIERTLVERVRSADVEDRRMIERAYIEGTRETRRALLQSLLEERVVDQIELLRAAIFGLDLELAAMARRALAQCDTDGALDLMADVLKSPLEQAEREMLLAAVERLGQDSKRARTLAALHSGLSRGSAHIERKTPEQLAQEYATHSTRTGDIEARAEAAQTRPEAPGPLLELAEALLERALTSERRYADLLYRDAQLAALEAEERGARGPKLDAIVAVASAALGDHPAGRARAVAAIEGGLLRPGDDAPPADSAGAGTVTGPVRTRLLQLFADARQRAIRDAYRSGDTWPPEWLSDVNAAYSGIAEDPLVEPETLVGFHDFLRWIGATPRANRVLDDALLRFPDSPVLHERLRMRLLWESGPTGLEEGYAQRLAAAEQAAATLAAATSEAEPASQLTWFAGYASLVAAEQLRRRNQVADADAAYDRAIALYRRNIEQFPEGGDTCEHFIALAHAGQSRIALERGDLEAATQDLLSAFDLRPDSAATPDGLNLTPIQTAKMLMAQLLERGDAQHADQLQAALEALDPKLFEPLPEGLPGSPTRNQIDFTRRR